MAEANSPGLGEFDIIARYFAPLAGDPASLKLRDDAAVLRVPEGQELVVTCDTIVERVHFLAGDPPETVGHKALAVSLSDLAAKGARPLAYLLSLSLPEPVSATWLGKFAEGLGHLQREAGIGLIGGDTTASPGPLSVSITALGVVPQGHAVLRLGAKPGDLLYVSGTIGDAYLGLRLAEAVELAARWGLSKEETAFLIDRYRRPQPRCGLALLIRNAAHAAIDVSDGLLGDVEKLCRVSTIDALIELERVPLSDAASKVVEREPRLLSALMTAGDDYEIAAAIPEARAGSLEAAAEAAVPGLRLAAIGRLMGGKGEARVVDSSGNPLQFGRKGFAHF